MFKRIASLRLPRCSIFILLLWLSVAGYVLFVNRLGYYWDDWAFIWIAKQLGTEGLQRYFATNRVFWGYLYQLSAQFLGSAPWQWQVYALTWHWLCTLSLWWFLRQMWRGTPQAAAWVSILFAIYPGYSQQPIAILAAHFYIVLTCFFLSLGMTLVALRQSGKRMWIFSGLALWLAAVNLLTLEYFFLLELLRPMFIYVGLKKEIPDKGNLFKRVLGVWSPYLIFFVLMAIWRAFFFNARAENFQAESYQMIVLQGLKEQPFSTLVKLGTTMLHDLWLTTGGAWTQALIPDLAEMGPRTLALYGGLVFATLILSIVYLLMQKKDEGENDEQRMKSWGWQALLIGAISLLPAGVPFWLTELPIGLTFPNDRFTLPFTFGASFLLAGLIRVLALKHWQKVVLLSLLASLAVGWHFQVATNFRRDWERQKALFWQMTWRMPALKAGTTLLANDWEPRYYSDNSLTAPLNWIYAPDNHSDEISYMFYFPAVRLGYGLTNIEKGLPIEQNYLAGTFVGSTSQAVAIYYGSDGCLRVLDPWLDGDHYALGAEMRRAALISTTEPIVAVNGQEAATLPEEIFGVPSKQGWCYYFEKADLARQQGQWEQIVELGDAAFNAGDNPNDPSERTPFIEGYAHSGNWERAHELTIEAQRVTPLVRWMLCRLWQRIDEQTPSSVEKTTMVQQTYSELECGD